MVIGALIIKHKLYLSDRDTVEMKSENMYLQYLYDMRSVQTELPFDASLFVEILKQLRSERFVEFNEIVIRCSEKLKPKRQRIIKGDGEDQKGKSIRRGSPSFKVKGQKKDIPNQGKLKLDACIADQYLTAPNDVKLVNRAREETERLVDALYQKGSFDPKPPTYWRNARKEYLPLAKKRNKSKQEKRVMLKTSPHSVGGRQFPNNPIRS